MKKNIDLRKQLTDELKNTWYYKQVKWGLKINKNSVVFDDDFRFELKDLIWEDWPEENCVYVKMYINNEEYKTLSHYYGEDRLMDSPKEILENIVLYIANYI